MLNLSQQVHENKLTYVFLVFMVNFYVRLYYIFCNSNSQLVFLKTVITIKYGSVQKKFKKLHPNKTNFYSWVN